MLHQHDQVHFTPLVDPVARAILGGAQEAKLAFPVPQHVRAKSGEVADFPDGEILLDWIGLGHASCSGRSSRVIISLTARRAVCPSKRMRFTISTMGISTSYFAASWPALLAVTTPSATVCFPSSACASVAPRPIASPTARLRLSEPVHVS